MQLRFEASVCAAIPVIKVLRESMIVSGVHRIDGIVNGTTNFILSQMVQTGTAYADALAEAQRLGYAEADPTEDVTGADAAAKIAILASIAFHTRVRSGGGRSRGHRPARPGRRRARRRARLRDQADRLGDPVGLGRRGPRAPLPRAPRSPAGDGRGRVQRRDAAGRVDPRGDPRGPGRRRRRDRDGRHRRPAGRDRHPGHRVPPARRLLPRARPAAGAPSSRARSTCASTSRTSRACSHRSPRRWPTGAPRSPRSCSTRPTACTSSS